MKTETITMYVTEDGVKHETQEAAAKHESEVIARRKSLAWFLIHHSPDCTEGRGMYGITTLAVESGLYPDLLECFVHDWCYARFGKRVAYVQGTCPTPNWLIGRLKEEPERLICESRVGDTRTKGDLVFISNGGPLAGFPEPIPVQA